MKPRCDEDWYDDFYHHQNSMMVMEEDDEPPFIVSSLLGPDGTPIIYENPSEKLGFIGFVDPDDLEHLRLQNLLNALAKRAAAKRPTKTTKKKTNAPACQ